MLRAVGKKDRPAVDDGGAAEDAIYEKLLTAIFEHRLPPGTKLGEDRLAGIFGVSRARIRSVLPRLAHEGVVRLEPNRGAFVAKPSVAEARDVFETRRILEPAIAQKLALDRSRRSDLAPLRQHVAAEARARASGDTRAVVRLSGEFHVLLAERSGNEVLAKTMRELASLTCLIIALAVGAVLPGRGARPDRRCAGGRRRRSRSAVDGRAPEARRGQSRSGPARRRAGRSGSRTALTRRARRSRALSEVRGLSLGSALPWRHRQQLLHCNRADRNAIGRGCRRSASDGTPSAWHDP